MTRCFLDVDGVLADFNAGIYRKLGLPYDPLTWAHAKGPDGWDFHKDLNMSFAEMSGLCDETFWENLPWWYDGRDILRIVLDHFGQQNITLLTTPMPHYQSPTGKWLWIKKNLPEYEWQTMICCGKKDVLATLPGSILIDDCQRNVDAWEKAGGLAVLVPRWWNNLWPQFHGAALVVEHRLNLMEGLCE